MFSRKIIPGGHACRLGHIEQPKVGVVSCFQDVILIDPHGPPTLDGHLHVRLAGAEPDLSDKDILENYRLTVRDGDGVLLITSSGGIYIH